MEASTWWLLVLFLAPLASCHASCSHSGPTTPQSSCGTNSLDPHPLPLLRLRLLRHSLAEPGRAVAADGEGRVTIPHPSSNPVAKPPGHSQTLPAGALRVGPKPRSPETAAPLLTCRGP